MPLLDVADVLFDPDFADVFDVVRYAESVNERGRSVRSEMPLRNISGVIQNVSELSLQRLPDGARLANTIEIHTTFALTSGVGGQDADEVIFQGATYTVTDVADWSRYGVGYYRALCQMKDIEPAAV